MIYIYVDVEDILLASFGKRLLTWFDNKYSIMGEPKVAGGNKQITVKIVNNRGMDSLKILEIK